MTPIPASSVKLHIGAWYGDQEVSLQVPSSWIVDVLEPSTPEPIDDDDIAAAIANPVGQAPLRQLARGKRRPLIVVDDLTRPTPTDRVVPHLLRELDAAGISPQDVGILLATGTHGPPPPGGAAKKAGHAGAVCRVMVHDASSPAIDIGRTSFGTPVLVDREVALSDLVIGVGGVYPQHSVGFGGGSKLILGVLAKKSIVGLHYGHPSVAGSYDTNNDFRRDLDEMARRAGMRTVVTLHVDSARRPVRVVAGDPARYYEDAALFSRQRFTAPAREGRYDVVIVNAYPMDVSLTFARSKGLAPFAGLPAEASRVLIAACPEGLGYHGLFPYLNGPRFEAQVHRLRRWSTVKPAAIPGRAVRKARSTVRKLYRRAANVSGSGRPRQQYAGELSRVPNRSVHLWTPLAPPGSLPDAIAGFLRARDWQDVLRVVEAEQKPRQGLRVAVYPCAPLQCVEAAAAVAVEAG